jgi:hypothetical protein
VNHKGRGGKLDGCTQTEGKSSAEQNPHTLGIRGDHTDGSATRTDEEGYGELEDGWHIGVSMRSGDRWTGTHKRAEKRAGYTHCRK